MRLRLKSVPLALSLVASLLAIPALFGGPPERTAANPPLSEDAGMPTFVTGTVVLSDGTPLAEPVPIERVCGGESHREGYTDASGHFSVQLGAISGALPASEGLSSERSGDMRPGSFANCEIRSFLPGFRSDSAPLAGRRWADSPEIGTIVLHRMANVEGFTISATSMLAPKDARRAYEKGVKDAGKKKPDEAIGDFDQAVDIYPKFAAAWYALGSVYEGRHQTDQAREAYLRAIAADANYINPYERLYMLALKDQKWQEVADDSECVTRLNPFDFPAAYYFNAVSNLQLNRLDAAEKSARQALKLDQARRNPKTNYILGLILGRKRQFPESAAFLRAYLTAAPNAPDAAVVGKQLVETERLAQAVQ